MKKYTEEKQKEYERYVDMYDQAPREYRGHIGSNAMSLYVDDTYNINAVANDLAASAMRFVLHSKYGVLKTHKKEL